MKKGIVWVIVIAVVVLIGLWFVSGRNRLVKLQEGVNTAWAQVENQYQRRSDLIPNLVNTVKGYTTHEASTLENVTLARAAATQITISPENLTPESLELFQQAQGQVSSALGRLMAIAESYPDLKASEQFKGLQVALEGAENRIATERGRFNEAARAYNTKIRLFPTSILAGLFGFNEKPYFEAVEGADVAPVVEF